MLYFEARIQYDNLTAKQKEIYNFQKVSSHLADYGYTTIKLDNDWMGADFIAVHFDGNTFLKIQLKSRLTFDKKYCGQNLFICFLNKDTEEWIIYPHDELLQIFEHEFQNSSSWIEKGLYHYPYLTQINFLKLSGFIVK